MKTKSLQFLFLVLFGVFSCKKLDIVHINKITTDTVELSDSLITVSGTLVDIATGGIVTYGHCWSATNTPTVQDSKTSFGNTELKQQFFSKLSALEPNTTYYLRAYLDDGKEISYGKELSFNSSIAKIKISTDLYTYLSTSSVSVGGTIKGIESVNGADYGHCWSTTNPPSTADNKTTKGIITDHQEFTSTISELSLMTSYFVRSYAKLSESVYAYGNTIEVVIPDLIVQTDSFALQLPNEALLKLTLVSIGIYPVTDVGHCWSVATSKPSVNDNVLSLGSATQTGSFSTTLPNMELGVTYYYRAYAIFGNTVRYGSTLKLVN